MKRRRVAIIGAGFSGAAVAAQLLKLRGRMRCEVVLIERGRRFGPGLAYGGSEPQHLLNVRASNMSALADQPDHFAGWLERRQRSEAATSFAPRTIYGQYLEDSLNRAARFSGLRRVRAEIAACCADGARWRLATDRGEAILADAVVLATGNPASAPLDIFAANDVRVLDAWDPRAVRRTSRGAAVLIIGAGLTMIDVALTLSRGPRIGLIYALSRRGLIPRAHQKSAAPANPESVALRDAFADAFPDAFPDASGSALSEALHALRVEIRAGAQRGEPWQYSIDRLRGRTPELWRALTLDQQRRFLRHLRPWWDVHRHRAAPQIAEQVAQLQAAGKLRVLAGEVVGVNAGVKVGARRNEEESDVFLRQRGSLVRHRLVVSRVINCTGASLDVATSQDPLMRQLIGDGLVRAHPTGLGIDVDRDGRVLGHTGAPHASLFALGALTQGAFWECTAVPELRVRAVQLAETLSNPNS